MKIRTLTATALFLLLAACNTFQGMGQDISNGGSDLSSAAQKTKNNMNGNN